MKPTVISKGFRTWWASDFDGHGGKSHEPEGRRYEAFIARPGGGEFIPIGGAVFIDQDAGVLIANKPHPEYGKAYQHGSRKRTARFEARGRIVIYDHGAPDSFVGIPPSRTLSAFMRMRLAHLVRKEDPDPTDTRAVFTEHCLICGYEVTALEWQGAGYCSKRCKDRRGRRR